LKAANHKTELATRDKDTAILRDHRTRQTNTELCTKQLELIDEVLELKADFLRDQTRIRKAAKLNKRLETTVGSLKEKVQHFASYCFVYQTVGLNSGAVLEAS